MESEVVDTSGVIAEQAVGVRYNMRYVWMVCLAGALGGLLFGYDWVVIGGAKPFFEKYFNLTSAQQVGWAQSCALVGCLLGALLSGGLSDWLGRKKLLIFSAFLFVFSSIGTGLANTFLIFVVFRILGGVAIGLASNLSPMYIAEISPTHIRGTMVALNQITINVGILVAPLINFLIAKPVPADASWNFILHSWNGQFAWRWMFGVTAIPAAFFFLAMFFVPESPRWLAKNGNSKGARSVLAKIGGESYADAELAQINATLVNETERVDFRELLAPKMLKIVLIGMILAVFQQWCGINVIFNYAEEVFSAAGFDVKGILFNAVLSGAVFLFFGLIALVTVDKLGRRLLMLIGSAGLAITYVLCGISYVLHIKGILPVLFVLAAIACYAISLAPIVWVLLSEIFPNRIRGAAMAIGVFALWAGCFTLTYTFPFINRALGMGKTFWMYAAICAVGFLFVLFQVPETKGKSLEEIERQLVG